MSDLATLSQDWVRSSAYVDLTARQMALIGIVCDYPGPHLVRHLATQLGVQKPVITRCLIRFSALGLIDRRRGDYDRRDVIVTPTDKGRSLRRAMRAA